LIYTKKMTSEQALEFYDSLEPITFEELLEVGEWHGAEIETEHIMDGVLEAVKWHGKRFEPNRGIHPLLYKGITGKIHSVDAGKIPFQHLVKLPRWLIRIAFVFVAPLIHTKKPCTQFWDVEYRGKRTGAMVWDGLPIVEVFARINENEVLGVTVSKWFDPGPPYFFTLTKPKT